MTDLRELLAQNLKKFRAENGYSQEKLAEKACVSTHYIGMIEMRRRFPSPEMLKQIAEALKVDTTDLFIKQPAAGKNTQHLQRAVLRDLKTNVANSVEKVLGKTLENALEKAVDDTIKKHLNNL